MSSRFLGVSPQAYCKLYLGVEAGITKILSHCILPPLHLFSEDMKEPEVTLTLKHSGSSGNRVGVDPGGVGGRQGGEYDQNTWYAHMKFSKNKNILLKKRGWRLGVVALHQSHSLGGEGRLMSVSLRSAGSCQEFQASKGCKVRHCLKAKEFLTSYLGSKGKCRTGARRATTHQQMITCHYI